MAARNLLPFFPLRICLQERLDFCAIDFCVRFGIIFGLADAIKKTDDDNDAVGLVHLLHCRPGRLGGGEYFNRLPIARLDLRLVLADSGVRRRPNKKRSKQSERSGDSFHGAHCISVHRKNRAKTYGFARRCNELTLFSPGLLSRFRETFGPLLNLGGAVMLGLAAREPSELLGRCFFV